MAFRPHGPTVIIPAAAAFSSGQAKQTAAGMNIRVRNSSSSIAWVIVSDNQADAAAAAIPVAGTPAAGLPAVISLAPGAEQIFNNPLGTSNQGAWVNACTPTDTAGTSFVEFAAGSGSNQ